MVPTQGVAGTLRLTLKTLRLASVEPAPETTRPSARADHLPARSGVIAPKSRIVLPHTISVPARDDTMAPLGSHERDRSSSGIGRWMRRRTSLTRKRPKRPLAVRMVPPMKPGTCREPPARNRRLIVPTTFPTPIPPGLGAIGSSVGSVRADSDGSIWHMTMTLTARSPSRCRNLNESLAPRMSRRSWLKPGSSPSWTIPTSCRSMMWVAPRTDSVLSCRSSSKGATWRSGWGRHEWPSGIRRSWLPPSPTPCTTPTPEGLCTGTSSRPTS